MLLTLPQGHSKLMDLYWKMFEHASKDDLVPSSLICDFQEIAKSLFHVDRDFATEIPKMLESRLQESPRFLLHDLREILSGDD